MVFTNVLTEQEVVESLIKESGVESGFIFKSYYDEENDNIILNNLYYDEDHILREGNVSQDDLGIPRYKNANNPRYVMITGSDESSHGGRMKVSSIGTRINKYNKKDYISIYRSNRNTISYIGDLKAIKMSTKEYNMYVELFLRNEDLIWSIYNNHGKFGSSIDIAFINDEARRRQGLIVIRDRITGDAKIFDSNNNLIKIEPIGR